MIMRVYIYIYKNKNGYHKFTPKEKKKERVVGYQHNNIGVYTFNGLYKYTYVLMVVEGRNLKENRISIPSQIIYYHQATDRNYTLYIICVKFDLIIKRRNV